MVVQWAVYKCGGVNPVGVGVTNKEDDLQVEEAKAESTCMLLT